MGLFSRNDSADSGRRSSGRSSVSSEAQANELRGRARRRLIGSLALVLAAVIVVPMLFDDDVSPETVATPVVVPTIVPPGPDTNVAVAPAAPTEGSGVAAAEPQQPLPATGTATDEANAAGDGTVIDDIGTPEPEEAAPLPAQEPAPAAKPAPKEPEKPRVQPKASNDRTDDGSVAIALLEGRTPPAAPAAKAATQGNFILQIAAYTTDKDAQSRRDRLVAAGVTNTYVENAVSSGKTTYRLRVGPFPSREAAQAAQARLRALGYDNGFISSK
jgi:DedD protein